MTARDSTVWALAEATSQPLEVVIFQAVAYEAWTAGGAIDGDWASTLTGVLNSSQPWRRQTHHHADTERDADAVPRAHAEVAADPHAAYATTVLGALGSPVAVNPALCERFCRCSLGEMTDAGFVGFPEEAATWAKLAAGILTVEVLEDR